MLTGAGIGGEYSAINSTIQELIPARYRGHTDIAINGSFWIGAAVGAFASILLLNPAYFSIDMGWRAAFFIGAILGLIILFMRMWIPESPRWLAIHGREEEAERDVAGIEKRILEGGGTIDKSKPLTKMTLTARTHTPLAQVFDQLFQRASHTFAGRARADVGAGLLLQRDLLHLCAGADALLQRAGQFGRLVHSAIRRRQRARTARSSGISSIRSVARS